ncbi:MAG: hypothetical protein J6T37_06955 [Bacteroidales bacterium]|jgi:hypothetical protein|nr:hypothetical protein [Bacteroidales bacterium]
MRKNFKIVATMAALLIAAVGVITFEACNKKDEAVKDISELNTPELSFMDKEMIQFGDKMKSATKTGETMPLEEAIRNFSNYQNFRLCDASRYSIDIERLTIEAEITLNNGNVNLSDLYSLYESNKKAIKDKIMSIEGDDKAVYCISSKIYNNNKDGGDTRIITEAFICRYHTGPGMPTPFYFDENLCWVYNQNACYGCTGGKAVDVLSERACALTIESQGYGCPAGYRLVFYDFVDLYLYASEYPDTNSPNGFYGLIHNDYEALCLDADDMLYYLNNIYNKILEWNISQQLNGRVIVFFQYIDFPDSLMWATYAHTDCTYVGMDD